MDINVIRNSQKLTAEILHQIRSAVGWPSSVPNCKKIHILILQSGTITNVLDMLIRFLMVYLMR